MDSIVTPSSRPADLPVVTHFGPRAPQRTSRSRGADAVLAPAPPSVLQRAVAALLSLDEGTLACAQLPPAQAHALAARIEGEAGAALSPAEAAWAAELRTAVIREWSAGPPPAADEIARLMAGFDRVLARPARDPEAAVVEFAHDLRSPLTSILFLAGALRDDGRTPLASAHRRQVGIIYSAALSLVSMTSDVVDYFRAKHEPAAETAPFSVREVMDSIRDMVTPMVEEGRVELRLVYPAVEDRLGSSVALSRVLLNLTANSLRHTREGFVEIAAREAGPGRVLFSVRDTGPGIPPEVQSTLYEPFSPREGRGLGFSSAGLGLGICRDILRAAGSELEFETAEGEGTTFRFRMELPLADHR